MIDRFGSPVAASDPTSVEAWNTAWGETLHFVGDPFSTLDGASGDGAFAMGSIFCAAYRLLGGAPFDAPEVLADLDRARATAAEPREHAHLAALELLAVGDFTASALRWDEINATDRDFAAVRFAHDVYLHVGNVDDRLRSAAMAIPMFEVDPGWNFVASQYAFALEEAGHFDDAERAGRIALEADDMDLWALHALAHVYESTNNQAAAIELLRGRQETWEQQDALAVHIWWHLALRLIAGGECDEVLAIHDALVPVATTPFRLSDLASLLWRLELVGVDVGERWDHLADAYGSRPEWHTSGFLDLHMALTYTRCPGHRVAADFFAGVRGSHETGVAENDATFREVVRPLVDAIRTGDADPAAAVATLDRIEPRLHRIGGSIAQRELVGLTKAGFERTAREGA